MLGRLGLAFFKDWCSFFVTSGTVYGPSVDQSYPNASCFACLVTLSDCPLGWRIFLLPQLSGHAYLFIISCTISQKLLINLLFLNMNMFELLNILSAAVELIVFYVSYFFTNWLFTSALNNLYSINVACMHRGLQWRRCQTDCLIYFKLQFTSLEKLKRTN